MTDVKIEYLGRFAKQITFSELDKKIKSKDLEEKGVFNGRTVYVKELGVFKKWWYFIVSKFISSFKEDLNKRHETRERFYCLLPFDFNFEKDFENFFKIKKDCGIITILDDYCDHLCKKFKGKLQISQFLEDINNYKNKFEFNTSIKKIKKDLISIISKYKEIAIQNVEGSASTENQIKPSLQEEEVFFPEYCSHHNHMDLFFTDSAFGFPY